MPSHDEKIQWMKNWCIKNECDLNLEGECGFGRDCVGIICKQVYPDYEWYNKGFDRIDDNGDVWTPDDAYHKHPCVAVLGHGEKSENQLYEWLKWFDEYNFILEVSNVEDGSMVDAGFSINGGYKVRMVRQNNK